MWALPTIDAGVVPKKSQNAQQLITQYSCHIMVGRLGCLLLLGIIASCPKVTSDEENGIRKLTYDAVSDLMHN